MFWQSSPPGRPLTAKSATYGPRRRRHNRQSSNETADPWEDDGDRHWPFPKDLIQEVNGWVAHGALGLANQPVFVLDRRAEVGKWDVGRRPFKRDKAEKWRRLGGNLAVDVEAGVPGSLFQLEAVLILRSCRPGRVGRWGGHHHEEWPLTPAPLQELYRHIGLRAETGAISTTRL